MQAIRSQTQHDVAGLDVRIGQEFVTFDGADGEAGQIIVTGLVEPRHFRGFTADQGAAGTPRKRLRCRA